MVFSDWYREGHERLVASGSIRAMAYTGAFLFSLLLSLVLTPPVRRLALKYGLVDQPGGRRIHTRATPRAGGVAVFLSFHLTLMALHYLVGDVLHFSYGEDKNFAFLVASTLLLAVGIWDDACDLKPYVKLAGQIAAATILYVAGFRVGGGLSIVLPLPIDFAVTLFWIVGAVNAFNLIDGMDGLASGLAAIAALGLAGSLFIRNLSIDALPFLALAGASIGFLRYNFNPASIFLGDSGSMFLGLAVGSLPLVSGQKSELLASLGLPLIVMGIPIFDTALAIWRRSMRAYFPEIMEVGAKRIRGFMEGDKEHIHHRILARVISQRRAAIVLYTINVLLVVVGLLVVVMGERRLAVFLLAFIVAVFLIVKHMMLVELWDTGRILLAHTPRSVSARIAVPFYITVDLLAITGALLLAHVLVGVPQPARHMALEVSMCACTIFVVQALAGVYQRIWSRSLLRDYVWLVIAYSIGVTLFVVCSRLFVRSFQLETTLLLVFVVLSLPLMMLARFIRDILREFVALMETKLLANRPDSIRVLVCGGGERLRAYLRERRLNIGRNNNVFIVGVLDDDPNLWRRHVFGVKVVGGINDLVKVVEKLSITEILITAKFDDARLQEILELAGQAGLPVREWRLDVITLAAGGKK